MSIAAEYELAAVIVVIYLIDCVVLLYANEGLLEHGAQRSRIVFGSSQPWVAGRRVALLDPFAPLVAVFRATWQIRDEVEPASALEPARAKIVGLSTALEALSAHVAACWVLVLVALPVALCIRLTLGFVVVAVLAWIAVWMLVVRLWRLRGPLDLSRGAFALLAFECLACPPNAANLVRKLSLRVPLDADLVTLNDLSIDALHRADVLRRIDREVEARLTFLDEDSAAFSQAVAFRASLSSTSPNTAQAAFHDDH